MTGRGGFTVLEQLVSLALLSVLAVGLTGALQFGIGVHMRAKSAAEKSDILTSRGYFRRMLERASLGQDTMEFVGTERSISFYTQHNLDFVTGIGPMRVYTSVTGEDLHLFIEPSGIGDSSQTRQSTILSYGSGEPQFSYFDGETWSKNWTGRGDLPKLVSMELENNDANRWPKLIIELFYAGQ